jgi:HlyD family secretion protein
MSNRSQLFRATALERLSSPEQLDRLVTITGPRTWLALAALCFLVASAVAWGVFGSVPRRVAGHGILVPLGGSVYDATAAGTGNIVSIKVAPGATVDKGEAIAELTQPAARQMLDHARALVADLKEEHARLAAQYAAEDAAHKASLERRRMALAAVVEAARQRVAYNDQMLASLGTLARAGDVTRQRVQETTQARQQAEQELKRAESDLVQLESEGMEAANRRRDELTRAQMRVNDADRKRRELEVQFEATSSVLAPVDGRVTEIKVAAGAVVNPGMPIASIQSGDQGLELVLYVPPRHGKEVKPGMTAHVEPATLPKEEYGTVLGEVVSVSEFPATREGMQAMLQNAELVRQFTAEGPPYAARVRLVRAEGGESPFVWSSGKAPGVAITAGTLANATVTVSQDVPIALVIPLLKKMTGLTH